MDRILQPLKDYVLADKENYQGVVDERFKALAEQFSRLQHARTEQGGAALVIYFQGQKVLDIYTGKKSENEAWQEDTMSLCYSTGKGVRSEEHTSELQSRENL